MKAVPLDVQGPTVLAPSGRTTAAKSEPALSNEVPLFHEALDVPLSVQNGNNLERLGLRTINGNEIGIPGHNPESDRQCGKFSSL